MLKTAINCTAAVAFVTFCGCTAQKNAQQLPPPAVYSPLNAADSEELRLRAEDFTQAMVRSFKTGDFKHWKAYLEKESAPGKPLVVEEKKFLEMRERFAKEWGTLTKCHYLGALDQSVMRDYIWKCTFETQDGTNNTICVEELFVVRCTLIKGNTFFTNFGFRFFNRPGFRDMVIKLKKAKEERNEKTH